MEFKITVSPSVRQALDYRPNAIADRVAEKMSAVFYRLFAKIQHGLLGSKVHMKSGRLMSSLTVPRITNEGDGIVRGEISVGEGVEYAAALERGSRAHSVVAVDKRSLRFMLESGEFGGSKELFRKQVMLKEQAAREYFGDPVADSIPEFVEELTAAVHEALGMEE